MAQGKSHPWSGRPVEGAQAQKTALTYKKGNDDAVPEKYFFPTANLLKTRPVRCFPPEEPEE